MPSDTVTESLAKLVNNVRKATNNGCHTVLSLAPVIPVIEASTLLIRPGGTIVMVAIPRGTVSLDLSFLVFNGIKVIGSIIGTRTDVERALAFAARGIIKCHTHIRSFNEINEVLAEMREAKYEGRVVLRAPQERGIV